MAHLLYREGLQVVTFLNCPWHVAWVSFIAKIPGWTTFSASHCVSGMFFCSIAQSAPLATPSDPPNTWTCLYLKLQVRSHSHVVRFYSESQRGNSVLGRLFPRPPPPSHPGWTSWLPNSHCNSASQFFCVILIWGRFPSRSTIRLHSFNKVGLIASNFILQMQKLT